MNTIRYTNFDGLLNQGVSDFLLKVNELTACKNVWVYKIGKLEKVPGYVKIDSILTGDVNCLHYYYQPSTRTNRLISGANSGSDYVLKYRTDGNWNILSTYTGNSGAKLSMVNFLDKVFIVGYDGTNFLNNSTINGTTVSTSDSDLTNMPKGKYIVRYRDLLYVLYPEGKPSRAYYCTSPVTESITWADDDTNFISFGYDDGDEITGGVEAMDRLVVFKHYSMWAYDESSRQRIADIGCDSYGSIQKINDVLYWSNRQGVFRWTGQYPELISAKAQPFFDALDQSTLENQVATVYNHTEYRLFIGTVTVEGITYTNAWWCFDTHRNSCYIRCTHDKATSACNYIENDKQRAYFGTDTNYVMKFADKIDKVYSDDGNEIDSFFITKSLDHGEPENVKNTNQMILFTKNAVGMKCAVEKDNRGNFEQESINVSNNNISQSNMLAQANRYRYKFYEKGAGKSWQFEGFVIRTDLHEVL